MALGPGGPARAVNKAPASGVQLKGTQGFDFIIKRQKNNITGKSAKVLAMPACPHHGNANLCSKNIEARMYIFRIAFA